MIYIDTNIIIRLILNDSPIQTKKIISYLDKIDIDLYIPSVVVMEIFQVLTAKRLSFSHRHSSEMITQLLFDTEKIVVEHSKTHLMSLKILKKKKIDYVDAFLIAESVLYDCKVLSFDKDLDKIDKSIRIKL